MVRIAPTCSLCLTEGVEKYEIHYLDKTMTASQIIEELKCKPYTWRNHINNHVKPQVGIQLANREELVDHIVDKVGEVMVGLEDVKTVIASLRNNILNNPDPNMLKTYLSFLTELRHYTETLQKLQGDFKEGNKLQAQTINIQYNSLAGQIMQDACQVCKKKFVKTLAPILKEQ